MSEAWEDDCLAVDPFEGDFGDTKDRTLKDKIVIARKHGPCHLCGSQIEPKEKVRSRSDIFDGELMYFRWCNLCCKAMAKSWTDDGEEYEQRAHIRKEQG